MQPLNTLLDLPAQHTAGHRTGITSICSAHPLVIEAALLEAADTSGTVLIEATCNQVNQDGGYTGMNPAGFRDFVLNIAASIGFPAKNILFGGDHLGPNPWRKLPAAEAMEKACVMTAAYAQAGFSKIHLDASMACADDPDPLPATTIAQRAARLAQAAETAASSAGHPMPAYIIGTEVPVPGGAAEELDVLIATTCDDTTETLNLHREAFHAAGLDEAFQRSIGLVVQPGVEFGHANVIHFDNEGAQDLASWRDAQERVVFEAHSTDYQTPQALHQLVSGGFAILKVGPALTFALREAYYALDQIAGELSTDYQAGALRASLEQLMIRKPEYWEDYYRGSETHKHLLRHFSYSDRIRYYWTDPDALKAVEQLFQTLEGVQIPETLVSQYLPQLYRSVALGTASSLGRDLVLANVRTAIAPYTAACQPDNKQALA
ncbi:D-tagatose-1,6-bisphosphate aldolase subunit GatZ [Granulosicoccus antarcticus IMCC3135]|uniref:D-tagatose-1,6-bisphosphate aldolase subunit GatZ n=2 Tax=Granulosicoccus TaxID=437504 RepID=A0A2Z2NQP8_9GAMM|nr:D-tagatose-1,6-bisphosphate aldolase subunit GatZ [Granulosicoccus antarcticus IMCC3135]